MGMGKIQGRGVTTSNYPEIDSLKEYHLDFRELSKFFVELASDKGGGYAYRALAKAAALGYLSPVIDQHLLGHVIGDIIFEQNNIEGIKECSDDLRNACSHSIVIGAFLEQGMSALPEIKEACHLAPGGGGAYGLCIHGLGHGILAYLEYDMEEAIKLCEKLNAPGPNVEYSECTGGIAMEMMSGVNDLEAWEKQKPNYFKKDDPLSPCDMDFMTEEAAKRCYSYLTPHLFEVGGANMAKLEPKYFEKALSFCEGIPQEEVENRKRCFGGFGKEFIGIANDRNIQNVSEMDDSKLSDVYEWCKLAPTEGVSTCLDSALQALYWGGENERGVAIRFCDVMSEDEYQSYCFNQLIGAVGYYIKDEKYKREFCDELPSSYVLQCKQNITI